MRIEGSGAVLHCELDLAGMTLSLTAVFARAEENGAKIVFPVADREYGMRDGRFEDPSGHLWIVSKMIEHISEEDLNALDLPR